MEVTGSQKDPQDLVPIGVRYAVLRTWVQAKQMLQSQINKGLGTDKEVKFYCFPNCYHIDNLSYA